MITESQKRLIDETLDRFDANKVAKVMELLEWTWVNTEETYPQPHEIRKTARRLLEDAIEYTNTHEGYGRVKTGTGGLYVEIDEPDGRRGLYVILYFAAETSDFDSEWLNEEPSW